MSDFKEGDTVYLVRAERETPNHDWPLCKGYRIGETFTVIHAGDVNVHLLPLSFEGRDYEESGIYVSPSCIAHYTIPEFKSATDVDAWLAAP